MKKLILLLLLTIIIIMMPFTVSSLKIPPPIAPALYVFGDSLLDNGNNNLLPTLAKANFSPYGINFKGGLPTGRFTNGRTVADFIAEFLDLPHSPPYMTINGTVLGSNQLNGLNFASAGCGILPNTGYTLGKCLSIADQIDLFEKIVHHQLPNHYQYSHQLVNYMSKSVFMVSLGSNDYIHNYLLQDFFVSSKLYTPQTFAKHLIDTLSLQFQRLYRLGARRVITFEIGPIGCIPMATKTFAHTGQCVEDINKLAIIFNNHLASMLQNLTLTLQGSTFSLARVFDLAYDAITNPSKYGFIDSHNACCLAWLNGASSCIPELQVLACLHPDKHFFWDGYHLTENVYKIMASNCFNNSSVCIPKSIKELVLQV